MPRKILVFFLFLYVFFRSVNFSGYLNFSYDQAWASTRALEIWQNREFTLVGPGNSIITGGKQMIQGSINYYLQLLFLLLGNFDPVISSYLFMLFCAIMILPLYRGVELLHGSKAAIMSVIFYTLLPLYIDFTRFFFAPNFQFSLLPLLIFFTGKYKQTGKSLYYFLVFFMIGLISQFHYATLVFLPLLYFYLDRKKLSYIYAISGFIIGFLPIIIFELKNNFYNSVVFAEYLRNSRSLSNFVLLPHRYLSLSLLLIIFTVGYFKKNINNTILFVSCILFLVIDLFFYFPKPKQAFGMTKNWNYQLEKKAFEIIRKENLKEYNVANLIYDNKSVVIKYLMKKNGLKIDYDDYYKNKYLFVIAGNEKLISSSPAYEIKAFSPRKKIKSWQLNNNYNLYLFGKT